MCTCLVQKIFSRRVESQRLPQDPESSRLGLRHRASRTVREGYPDVLKHCQRLHVELMRPSWSHYQVSDSRGYNVSVASRLLTTYSDSCYAGEVSMLTSCRKHRIQLQNSSAHGYNGNRFERLRDRYMWTLASTSLTEFNQAFSMDCSNGHSIKSRSSSSVL